VLPGAVPWNKNFDQAVIHIGSAFGLNASGLRGSWVDNLKVRKQGVRTPPDLGVRDWQVFE